MGRTFTLDYKLEAANYAEINGIKKAARKFDVDPKSIREWRFLKNPITGFQSDFGMAHHSINLDTKLNAIKYAEENGIEAAAKKFNVNPEGIQKWCNGRYIKGALKRVPQNKNLARKFRKKTLINVGRNCVKKDIENRLVLWITEQLKNNVLITKPMIKVKALELLKSEHKECQETFKASLAWVQEFLVRKRLNISCNNFFTKKFKLQVVKSAKKNGILTAAKEYNVNPKYVRDWYNQCNLNAVKKAKTSGAPRRIQRAFTLDFKLNAIKYAKENGLSAAAKEYNVDRKSIFEWCKGRKLKDCLKPKQQGKSIKKKNCIDVNEESTCNSHFDKCTFNKVAENQFLLNKKDSFSLSPKVVLLDIFKQKSKSNASIERSPSMIMMEPNGVKSSSAEKVTEQDSVDCSPSMIMIGPNSEESSFSTKMMVPNLEKSSSSLEVMAPSLVESSSSLEVIEPDLVENSSSLEVMEPDLVENSTSMIMTETNSMESFPSIKMMKPNSVKSASSAIMRHKKSENVDKPISDLKSVKIDSHKIVKASKRKISTENVNLKKKKLFNCVSSSNSHLNSCTVANENQLTINTKKSFSLCPSVILLDIFQNSTWLESSPMIMMEPNPVENLSSIKIGELNSAKSSIKVIELESEKSSSSSIMMQSKSAESSLAIIMKEPNSVESSHSIKIIEPNLVESSLSTVRIEQDSVEDSSSTIMMEPHSVKNSPSIKMMEEDSVESSLSVTMTKSMESSLSIMMEPNSVENLPSVIMMEPNSAESFPSTKMMEPNRNKSLPSIKMRHRKSRKVNKPTSDLKSVKIDLHKSVQDLTKKVFKRDMKFKKKKLISHAYNSQFNCKPSNEENENQLSIKIKDSFSLYPKVTLLDIFKQNFRSSTSADSSSSLIIMEQDSLENFPSRIMMESNSFESFPCIEKNPVEGTSSVIITEQKAETVNNEMLATSDLKFTKNNMHKTVKVVKRNVSTGNKKFKKKKLVNHVSSYNSHSNTCPSNVVNEDEISIKIEESFSLNSQSTSAEESFYEIESPLENISCTESERDGHTNQSVHPLTVQGLIASIAFQTFFNGKPT
ncbi:serine-rich adhesin for platelets-like [Parasteatoda tepidariorum]|uniref:serine-rich adhesin for platelets-like n=1 Tax=Parasteatoda tepidariorum TaxID=114398 RepID=UPI0039BD7DC5